RWTDLSDHNKVGGIRLGVTKRVGDAFWKVGDIAGFDRDPLAAQVNLTVALQADHRLVGHIVLVAHTFFAWREGKNVNAFGLKTIAGPCNQAGSNTLCGNLDSVIKIGDGAVRPDLVVRPKPSVPFSI